MDNRNYFIMSLVGILLVSCSPVKMSYTQTECSKDNNASELPVGAHFINITGKGDTIKWIEVNRWSSGYPTIVSMIEDDAHNYIISSQTQKVPKDVDMVIVKCGINISGELKNLNPGKYNITFTSFNNFIDKYNFEIPDAKNENIIITEQNIWNVSEK